MKNINTETIRLEGNVAPEATKLWLFNLILIASFDGQAVRDALLLKAGHMAPGKQLIYLEISGQCKDGTPFKGTASIELTNPP